MIATGARNPARIALCLLAAAALASKMPLATAALILASTLLDQSRDRKGADSPKGNVDWLATILARIVITVWWAALAPAVLPLLLIAISIELANCVLQIAGRPPLPNRSRGFAIALNWSIPGVFRLAWPLFAIACCLDLTWPARSPLTSALLHTAEWALALPVILYFWRELALLVCIAGNPRTKLTYDDGPGGMQFLGVLPASQRELLQQAWSQSIRKFPSVWQASLEQNSVFWSNLWQDAGDRKKMEIDCIEELDLWARRLVASHYDAAEVDLDGYGLIANPVGSKPQAWHIDYTLDYSTIFIPLTEVSPENALQYAVLPSGIPPDAWRQAVSDLDAVDLDGLSRAAEWVSIRQLLARPFTLIKLDFCAIHRGIANTGDYHRVLFWVSVRKKGAKSAHEPFVQSIPEFARDGESN